jgi:hypothetical protein
MTTIVSPFRRLQDARAALTASGYGNAAWAEYEAAERAERDYEKTHREWVECLVESVARDYRELVAVEAAGGDTVRALRLLENSASLLLDEARQLRDEGVKR